MERYQVHLFVTVRYSLDVRAKTPAEAIEHAENRLSRFRKDIEVEDFSVSQEEATEVVNDED